MKYLWEAMIQAAREGIPEEKLVFCFPKVFSAYMETANPYINQDCLGTQRRVGINPYYRFFEIFKDLYEPDYSEGTELRDSLTNLILHQLAENDVLSGMSMDEYYKALLFLDIRTGKSGRMAQKAITLFSIDEQQSILNGMLRQYQTGSSIDLFRQMAGALIPDPIIYHNKVKTSKIMIYISRKKNESLEQKMKFLISAFLDQAAVVKIYYEYHFGIIGVRETMILGKIKLC